MDVRVLHLHAAAPQQNAIIGHESYKTCKAVMTTRSRFDSGEANPANWNPNFGPSLRRICWHLLCMTLSATAAQIGPSKSQSQRQIQLTQEVVSDVVTITIKRQTLTYSVSFAIPVNMMVNLRSQICLRNRNTCAIWVVHSGKCGGTWLHKLDICKDRGKVASTTYQQTHKHHCNHLNPSPTHPDVGWHVQWRYCNFRNTYNELLQSYLPWVTPFTFTKKILGI